MRGHWAWMIVLGVIGCSGGETPIATEEGGETGVPADGEVVDSSAPPTTCKADGDCLTGVSFTPANCASATCKPDGTCAYVAKDNDGDGIPAKSCSAPGVTIETGGDCDDGNAETKPGAAELCDGKDNDCDGAVDEDLPTSIDECTVGTGECKTTGVKTCVGGTWSGCSAKEGTPATEICDGKDNDCDGKIDVESCECVDGSEQECGKASLGSCKKGKQRCLEGKWLPCEGNIDPKSADSCSAGNDDDCDGIITNGPIPNPVCKCLNGAKLDCATALSAKGSCAKGVSTCTGGGWGPCSILPRASDTCEVGNDDTCDGKATSASSLPAACACTNEATISCSLLGFKGACGTSTSKCVGGAWNRSLCPTSLGADSCVADNDNSCNGAANEGCLCIEEKVYACSDAGAGICAGGTRKCTNGKTNTYTPCAATPGYTGLTTYRYDGDGDGKCAGKATLNSYPYPWYSYATREIKACSSPGSGWGTSCTGTDCYDGNYYYSYCPGAGATPLPPGTTVDWGKPWRGFGNCEDHLVTYGCPAGYHFSYGNVTKKNGGGNWWNLGCSGYGTSTGYCSGRVCDNGFESATLTFQMSCSPYGATPPF